MFCVFCQMKAIQGVKMSYRLQEVLRNDAVHEPIRGLRVDDGHPVALSSFIYSLIRANRGYRRGLLTSILNLFDDTAVSLHYARSLLTLLITSF